jgi:hypothetical protein
MKPIQELLLKSQFPNKKNYVRPGRDSNPGRRSDSPPYWTGMYEAEYDSAALYYPGIYGRILKTN